MLHSKWLNSKSVISTQAQGILAIKFDSQPDKSIPKNKKK